MAAVGKNKNKNTASNTVPLRKAGLHFSPAASSCPLASGASVIYNLLLQTSRNNLELKVPSKMLSRE